MKILSVDGGGIRGLIPALVLAEIERRADRPIADMVDLFAGTSTGGIIACALTLRGEDGRPRYRAAELAPLYEEEGPRIFDRSLLKTVFSAGGLADERYDSAGLIRALTRYLGDARLKDALCDVLVTAYDIEERETFLFRAADARARPAADYSLVDTALATSVAPTYFEPVRVTDAAGARTRTLIDGGVYATNPALMAYAVGGGEEIEVVASLGCGALTRSYAYEKARWWGAIEWIRPLIDIVFDGQAQAVALQLDALAGAGFVRLSPVLDEASDELDDASERNLRLLRREAEQLIAERAADIDALAAKLAG